MNGDLYDPNEPLNEDLQAIAQPYRRGAMPVPELEDPLGKKYDSLSPENSGNVQDRGTNYQKMLKR